MNSVSSGINRFLWLLIGTLFFTVIPGMEVESMETFTNPVAPDGHDPWVIFWEGDYYYCYSWSNRIWVNRSKNPIEAVQRTGKAIWRGVPDSPYCCNIWAPELHYLEGKWYVYFAADDGNNENHRMYVLEGKTQDAQGEYIFKGKISCPLDRWAIDGTVLEMDNQDLFFIWSGWEGTVNVAQHLYIAPMSNPWTISGNRVKISTPEYDWEKVGKPFVNEGPQVLKNEGRIFIIYSASGSWTDSYCLGRLTLVGDDPLDANSWVKHPVPVFAGTPEVISPGHCSFVKSPDGTEDWMVYHAAKHPGAGWNRNVRMQPFTWDEQGHPVFGSPVPEGVELKVPSNQTHQGGLIQTQ